MITDPQGPYRDPQIVTVLVRPADPPRSAFLSRALRKRGLRAVYTGFGLVRIRRLAAGFATVKSETPRVGFKVARGKAAPVWDKSRTGASSSVVRPVRLLSPQLISSANTEMDMGRVHPRIGSGLVTIFFVFFSVWLDWIQTSNFSAGR